MVSPATYRQVVLQKAASHHTPSSFAELPLTLKMTFEEHLAQVVQARHDVGQCSGQRLRGISCGISTETRTGSDGSQPPSLSCSVFPTDLKGCLHNTPN